jgi:hypothetical protein
MLATPCSKIVRRVMATHSIRQFALHFPSRASPSAIIFQLDSNARYTIFGGSVKGNGYPLHSPVSPNSPSRASPCAITFQLDSTSLAVKDAQKVKLSPRKDSTKHTGEWRCNSTNCYPWHSGLKALSNCILFGTPFPFAVLTCSGWLIV